MHRNRKVWHGTSHEYSWKLQRTTCLPGCLAIFTELAWRKKSKSSDFREIERNKAIDRGVHFRSRNIGVFTHIRASTSSEPAVVDLQSADCSRYSFEQINTHDRFTEECLTFWLILSDSDRSHILMSHVYVWLEAFFLELANDRHRDFITGSALHDTYTVTLPFCREFQHPYKTLNKTRHKSNNKTMKYRDSLLSTTIEFHEPCMQLLTAYTEE